VFWDFFITLGPIKYWSLEIQRVFFVVIFYVTFSTTKAWIFEIFPKRISKNKDIRMQIKIPDKISPIKHFKSKPKFFAKKHSKI
jgi:hypothetical protein